MRWARELARRGRWPGPLDVYVRTLSPAERRWVDEEFFHRLRLSNGTSKRTWPGRLDDLNEHVLPLLPHDRTLDVLDVAVSSGTVTVEWSDHLRRAGVPHAIAAVDLALDGLLLRIGRTAAALWQDDGHLLALQIGDRTIYRFDRSILRAVPPVLRLARPAAVSVPLVGPLIRGRSDIRLLRDDLAAVPRECDCVDVCRAANILSPVYFPDDVLRTMVYNLAQRLRLAGLLVVTRTMRAPGGWRNKATVVRKTSDGLELVSQLNGGSEIESLLLTALR